MEETKERTNVEVDWDEENGLSSDWLDAYVEKVAERGMEYMKGQLRLAKFNAAYWKRQYKKLENATRLGRSKLSEVEGVIRQICDEVPYGEDQFIDRLRPYVWNEGDTERKVALEGALE